MVSSVQVNGLRIETDKSGISVSGHVVVFGDGSTYNSRTGAFNNAGPGYVRVNGKTLSNSEGDPEAQANTKTETRKLDFNCTDLSLDMMSTDVSVEKHDGRGMHVEITGPANLIDEIKVRELGSTLLIQERSSGGGNRDTIVVSNGGFMSSVFGGNVSVGGVSIVGGNVSIGNFGGGNAVTIKVLVPYQTSIAIVSQSADIDIEGVNGPLDVSIQGSADVSASGASGSVRVGIAGSGDVRVSNGEVGSFNVAIAGSGDVRFGGTAGSATLSIAGSGDISLERVLTPPVKRVAGSGKIRVHRVG